MHSTQSCAIETRHVRDHRGPTYLPFKSSGLEGVRFVPRAVCKNVHGVDLQHMSGPARRAVVCHIYYLRFQRKHAMQRTAFQKAIALQTALQYYKTLNVAERQSECPSPLAPATPRCACSSCTYSYRPARRKNDMNMRHMLDTMVAAKTPTNNAFIQ